MLIASVTIVQYYVGRSIQSQPSKKKKYLILGVTFNILVLCIFKYFNFFIDNINAIGVMFGTGFSIATLQILLPVGISFYTFQSMSYAIDVYRGTMPATKSIVDFALYVSFFPQLVAGPIERAVRLLPQIQKKRVWNYNLIGIAGQLLLLGFTKKLVIADNIGVYVDKIFMLDKPGVILLFVGGIAFAIQIYADFSAYTDIARGCAQLLGFDIMENFKAPYIAISPSDFWRRWHISFSSWIRDYLYIPLGGSRVRTKWKFLGVVLTSMGLSGLWHGAAWNFVLWGVYHGVILFVYHAIHKSGKWYPKNKLSWLVAWMVMTIVTIFGWVIFRTSYMGWIVSALSDPFIYLGDHITIAITVLVLSCFYALPAIFSFFIKHYNIKNYWVMSLFYAFCMVMLLAFHAESGQDFIYFQF